MTTNEMYLECFKDVPTGTELSRKEIVKMMQEKFDIREDRILPSDVCYNSSNIQIEGNGKTRYFLKAKRGIYIYVGPHYHIGNTNPHEFGTVGHKHAMPFEPHSEAIKRQIGSWIIQNENLAAKETDDIVFQLNASVLPKELLQFFISENQPHVKRALTFSYDGEDYDAYISEDAESGNTVLHWDAGLGARLNAYNKTVDSFPILLFARQRVDSISVFCLGIRVS